MTPAEIRLIKEHVTQKQVDAFVDYMHNWMKAAKQPDKQLKETLSEMKIERCEPDQQMRLLLSSILDWFAYGN